MWKTLKKALKFRRYFNTMAINDNIMDRSNKNFERF